MTKNEFMEYLKYLEKTIGIQAPTDKEVLAAWYEPFQNIHIEIAKKMAKLYLQKEQGYFKLSKLLEYKSAAMAGVTYPEEQKKSCPACFGTGYVQIETTTPNYPTPYISCRRCLCNMGNKLPNYIKQVTEEELRRMSLKWNKVWKER